MHCIFSTFALLRYCYFAFLPNKYPTIVPMIKGRIFLITGAIVKNHASFVSKLNMTIITIITTRNIKASPFLLLFIFFLLSNKVSMNYIYCTASNERPYHTS